MPEDTMHKPGSFCWIELATTNQDAAKKFYSNLFGWTFIDNPMGPGEVYTMFQLNGLDTGAAFKIGNDMPGLPPNWALYVAVEDADTTASQAASLGGTLLKEPFDVFTVGRMAVIQDPTGATFCIWQANEHKGIGIAAEENAFCWADLITKDAGKAKPFYEQLFGWKLIGAKNDPSGYLHIQNGDDHSDMIGGIPPQGPQHGAPSHWLLYFQTSDCDGTTQKAEQHGARIYAPPMSIPGAGRFSVLADPQGAVFALFEPQNAA
jgi:predicted enzyme related to lactoylglutathione lyase